MRANMQMIEIMAAAAADVVVRINGGPGRGRCFAHVLDVQIRKVARD